MASFTFNGDQPMVYPTVSLNGETLLAVPGQTYDLDSAPDDRWTAPKAAPTPAPTPTPAEPTATTN